jgi:hypothetical protein
MTSLYQCFWVSLTLYRFPRREDVDKANATRLNVLHTDELIFKAVDASHLPDHPLASPQVQKIFANFMAPACLTLRIDAQVSIKTIQWIVL